MKAESKNQVRKFISLANARYDVWVLTGYFLLVLITVVPGIVSFSNGGNDWSGGLRAFVILNAVVSGSAFAFSAAMRPLTLSWSVFWMWTYVFLGLVPLYQLATPDFPWHGQFTEHQVFIALLVILAGCIAASTGFVVASTLKRKYASKVNTAQVTVKPSFSRAKCTILAVLIGYFLVATLFIGLTRERLFQGRESFWERIGENSPIPGAGTLLFLAFAGSMVLPAVAIMCRKNGVAVPIPLIAITVVLGFVITNPFLGYRLYTGIFLVATVGALLVRTRLARLLPAGIMLGLILIFPSLDILRADGTGATRLELSFPGTSLLLHDFDAFEMLLRAVHFNGAFVDGSPDALGLFLAPLLRFVPYFSDFVYGFSSGSVVAEGTGMSWTNVSMPLWGEGYVVAGFAGVVFYMAALGFLLGAIRQPFDSGRTAAAPTSLLIDSAVAALLVIVLRGSLYSILGYVYFAIAVALVLYFVNSPAGRSRPRRDILARSDHPNGVPSTTPSPL